MRYIIKSLLSLNSILTCVLSLKTSSNTLDRESATRCYSSRTSLLIDLRENNKQKNINVQDKVFENNFVIDNNIKEIREEVEKWKVDMIDSENVNEKNVINSESLNNLQDNNKHDCVQDTYKHEDIITYLTNIKAVYPIKETTSNESKLISQLQDNQESLKDLNKQIGNLKQKKIEKEEKKMKGVQKTSKNERKSFIKEKRLKF